MRIKTAVILLLPVFLTLTVCDVFADAPTIKAKGTFTSIEDDRGVIIDEKGYETDASLRVINHKGKNISLRSLPLPAEVRFEYIQTKTGFIITLIEQARSKPTNNKRGRR